MSWSEDVLRAAGHGAPQTAAMLEGFASAWSLHQALLIADRLPGGLSRPNLLLAARAMHLDNPSLADGVGYGMHGSLDGDLIEGALIVRYDGFGDWEPSDLGVIDASGHTPPCPWAQERRSCG